MNAPIKSISREYRSLHPVNRWILTAMGIVLAGTVVGLLLNATAAVAVGSLIMVIGAGLYFIQWWKEDYAT